MFRGLVEQSPLVSPTYSVGQEENLQCLENPAATGGKVMSLAGLREMLRLEIVAELGSHPRFHGSE